jgi:hypothetical protein
MAALTLAQFIQQCKRKTRYGDPANTTDSITADIVHYTNQRRFRLWRRYPWAWSVYEFTLALVAGTINYTLDVLVGDIVAIENGAGGYIIKRTLKRYLQWHKGVSDSGSTADNPSDYVRMGQDEATDALKIKVWPTPASAANRTGWGKKRLARYAVADIATNTDFGFFPEEVLDVLEAGVLADIYEAQGKVPESVSKNQYFQAEMERMVKEEAVEADSEEQRDPPDYMVFHKRKRGGTTVT